MRKIPYFAEILVVTVAILSGIIVNPGRGSADAAPIRTILAYIPELSNWGPTSATGIAEVVLQEGEVNITVVGLPPLPAEAYAGWLVNTRTDETFNVGYFNTDNSQVAKFHNTLPTEIPGAGWNLFLVTIESKAENATGPGERRAIGGYFPNSIDARQVPAQLPKTGGDSDDVTRGSLTPRPVYKSVSLAKADGRDNLVTYSIVIGAAIGFGLLARSRMRLGKGASGLWKKDGSTGGSND